MAKWTKVSGPRAYQASHGRGTGWAYTLTRAGGETVTAKVEVAGPASSHTDASTPAAKAIASKGWSAVAPFTDDPVLPHKLLVTGRGVSISEHGGE